MHLDGVDDLLDVVRVGASQDGIEEDPVLQAVDDADGVDVVRIGRVVRAGGG